MPDVGRVRAVEALLQPPILFASRGASAHVAGDSLEAFRLALRLGATGLATGVWRTADGAVVLSATGRQTTRLRKRPVSELSRSAVPELVTVGELLDCLKGDFLLLVSVEPASGDEGSVIEDLVELAANHDSGMLGRLWVSHDDVELLTTWRQRFGPIRLVNSARLRDLRHGPERRAAQLADAGIDAISMHHSDWSGGLVSLFHRFERLAFGWDAQHERIISALLAMGLDAVAGDHVDRLVDSS